MVIVDQFETEPTAFHSGSYTDLILRGSIFGTSTSKDIIVDGNRIVIASKVGGTSSNFNEIYHLYSKLLSFKSSSNRTLLQTNNNAIGLLNDEESYFDSYAASAIEYYLADTDTSVTGPIGLEVGSFGQGGSDIFNIPATPNPEETFGKIGIIIQFFSSQVNQPDRTANRIWYDTFPFESRYKNFSGDKLFKQTIIQPIKYTVTESSGGDPIIPSSSSNFFAGVRWKGPLGIIPVEIGEGVSHPTASQTTTEEEFKTPTFEINQKFVFGIGDGWHDATVAASGRNLPSYIRRHPVSLDIAYGIIIRGWKYGLINGLPQKSKLIFRKSRYGQFRDMLEQRPNTRYLIRKKGTFSVTDGAVVVRFVSGTLSHSRSIDYKTNTSPSYDPTDTGFFDVFYRSGQPFFDTR